MGEQREEGKEDREEKSQNPRKRKKDPDTDSLEVESLGVVKGS